MNTKQTNKQKTQNKTNQNNNKFNMCSTYNFSIYSYISIFSLTFSSDFRIFVQ